MDDYDIWKESFQNIDDITLFNTKIGGKNAKKLFKKPFFNTPSDRKMDSRIKVIEKTIKKLSIKLFSIDKLISKLTQDIKAIKNKPQGKR